MKISKRIVLTWMLAFVLAFTFIPAASAKTFSSESIENVYKPWKIHFSQEVSPSYVDKEYIYILDGNKKIDASLKLLNNGRTIEITPLSAYEQGKVYKLEVAGTIRSTKGIVLAEKASKTFEIVNKSAAIQSIKLTSNQGIYEFKVKAREDVYAVKINGLDMKLTGWNEFSQGFANLKPGTNVTIKAYNSMNRVIETKIYPLN